MQHQHAAVLQHHVYLVICWQVYGPESSGKTTLALHAMAAVQRAGGTALLVDAEHAFDAQYSQVTSITGVNSCLVPLACVLVSMCPDPPAFRVSLPL